MKRYELSLLERNPNKDFTFKSVDKCEGDTLVELLAHFVLLVAHIQRRQEEEEIKRRIIDDDIPF